MDNASPPPQPALAGAGPSVTLRHGDGDHCTVLLHGGHLVGWTAAGRERLYLSPTTQTGAGAAIRGGVPVVFPQFNQRGPDRSLPRHGFARNLPWQVIEQAADRVLLRLSDDAATRAHWMHRFMLDLTVTLGDGRLDLDLAVVNRGDEPFAFTAALHSYFAVGDIGATCVRGLDGIAMLDTVVDRTGVGTAEPLRFAGETDRIYWDAKTPLTMDSPNGPLVIAMQGFEDVVVWNPWIDRAAQLPDLPDADWRKLLCIEAARIGRPVELAPGARWQGRQALAIGAG